MYLDVNMLRPFFTQDLAAASYNTRLMVSGKLKSDYLPYDLCLSLAKQLGNLIFPYSESSGPKFLIGCDANVPNYNWIPKGKRLTASRSLTSGNLAYASTFVEPKRSKVIDQIICTAKM